MSGVHWPLAARVARRMAGSYPLEGTYHDALFARRAPEMVARAAELVADETGLSWSGIPSVAVVSRVEWAEANLGSFSRMLAPAEEHLTAAKTGLGKNLAGRLMGAEVGALVGVLSRKVLGQYELVLPSDDDDAGDTIMFVGGNVLAMERAYEFRPDEFRFWVALHECTHRLQFVGVPWMRGYFLSLVHDLIAWKRWDFVPQVEQARDALGADPLAAYSLGLYLRFAQAKQEARTPQWRTGTEAPAASDRTELGETP